MARVLGLRRRRTREREGQSVQVRLLGTNPHLIVFFLPAFLLFLLSALCSVPRPQADYENQALLRGTNMPVPSQTQKKYPTKASPVRA